MPSQFLIYGLLDPRTGLLRYIGKSTCGLRRPRMHRSVPKKEGKHKTNWLLQLQREGLEPEIVVLEGDP